MFRWPLPKVIPIRRRWFVLMISVIVILVSLEVFDNITLTQIDATVTIGGGNVPIFTGLASLKPKTWSLLDLFRHEVQKLYSQDIGGTGAYKITMTICGFDYATCERDTSHTDSLWFDFQGFPQMFTLTQSAYLGARYLYFTLSSVSGTVVFYTQQVTIISYMVVPITIGPSGNLLPGTPIITTAPPVSGPGGATGGGGDGGGGGGQ